MKNALVLLSVLVAFSSPAFAERNTYGLDLNFECDEKNLEIVNKIMERLPDGSYEGVNPDGLSCTVEVELMDIVVKNEGFVNHKKSHFDCLHGEEIACFELNPQTYAPLKGVFNSGNIFNAKVMKETDKTLKGSH